MSRSKGYGFQTKFNTEAHTTNSAAWPVHYACAVVFSLKLFWRPPAEHLLPIFPWVCPPPRYVEQFIKGRRWGGGGGGEWLLGGSLCDPSPVLLFFSSLCVFLSLSTPFVWHTGYRAGTYVPHSVQSASRENITTRLHMKGCRGVHNLCVGVGLSYQTSSSPQLQLR